MIEKMKGLIKQKDMCVLATAFDNRPHCSLMAYVTDDDCGEFYMATGRETTKYKNLTANPQVSLLIDTREEHAGDLRPETRALTVSGVFEPIADEDRRRGIQTRLLGRHPHLRGLMEKPDAEILCVRVLSFLLLDGVSDAHYLEI
ncbi:MAG: pyridoxamine 5'-phosphate oxidase family protein [Deltaproteobacteria bacterium]|nr:pyridoxamine 5'-phosphate oxidase family protein [Deltaproteobacteria bacterium]